MTEEQLRERIIEVAKTWIGTKYHNHAQIKGVGADCLTFIMGTYQEAELIGHIDVPKYSPQFMLHSSKETYIEGLEKYGYEVETPKKGDIAIWKFGRCFSHAGLVVEWPLVLHAYFEGCVQWEDATRAGWLWKNDDTIRPVKFFSLWKPDVPIQSKNAAG